MLESKVSTDIPLALQGQNPDPGRGLLVRCLMQVLWPAFIGAIITVGLLFSVIDPLQVEWVHSQLHDNRLAAYTVGFLVFWLLFSLTCSMSWYLASTETPKGKVGRQQRD